MITLLQREFTVDVGLQQAWDHLAKIEQWPSWALHMKKVELQPPDELGAHSTGVIHLTNGIKSAFRMTEFNPPRNWKWVGRILWLTIAYDHRFEAIDNKHTRLAWTVAAEGFGVRVLGPLFAMIYRGNMEKAIARLIREMNAIPASV
jgi:Polyketide cyclase / dehydrase and lipid transport